MEPADHLVPLFSQQVHDVFVVDAFEDQAERAEGLILRQADLHDGAVVVEAVDIPELSVGDLQGVLVSLQELFDRHDGIAAQVGAVLHDPVPFILLLLARIDRTEFQFLEAVLDQRILKFDGKAVLLNRFRRNGSGIGRNGILVGEFLSRPLGGLGTGLLVEGQPHHLVRRDQVAEGIRLVVVDLEEKGVGHLLPLVVDPDFQTVLLDVELGDQLLGGQSPDLHPVDLGIRRHKGDVRRPVADPFLLDNELLGRFLPEHVQLDVRLAGHAGRRILHVELEEFIQGVRHDPRGPVKRIQERNLLIVGIIHIVAVLIPDGIDPVEGVLDVPDAEKAPFIRLGGGNRPLEEDGGVRMVLVEEDGHPLGRFQVRAVLHKPRHAHRIDPLPGREDQGITREHVALVVVPDRAGQVERIGGVAVQVGLELHDDGTAAQAGLRLFLLGRGQVDVLPLLDRHIFIEGEFEPGLVCGHVDRPLRRLHLQDVQDRRDGVLRSAGRGLRRIGAAM